MAGISINSHPLPRLDEARTDAVAGQVPMMFDAIPTMREQIRGGKRRGLATTGTRAARAAGPAHRGEPACRATRRRSGSA